jgi:ABC-type sugar transport system ATPase subunit
VLVPEERKAEGLVLPLPVRENTTLTDLRSVARRGVIDRGRERAAFAAERERLGIRASGPEQVTAELSGGNQQKVVLAKWLRTRPRVLLLDEPTANLDLHHQVASLDVIRGLAQEHGLAVLAVLHDLQLAALYCDRVILLDQGQVVAQGSPEDVFTPSLLLATFGQPVAVAAHPTHGVPMVWLAPNGRARHRPQSLT